MKFAIFIFVIMFIFPNTYYAQACLPPILAVGDVGRVLGVTSNNVRAEPTTSGQIVGGIEGGGTFDVLELGTCEEGIRWVRVQATNGFAGWTAESVDNEPFVRRVIDLDTEFVELGNGNIAINQDGTLLATDDKLYDAVSFDVIFDDVPGIGDNLFSPTNPNLLFRYHQDYDFTLVDISDLSVVWAAEYNPSTGIGGGSYAGEAFFTSDGRWLIASSTAEDYSWQILDMDTLTPTFKERSYYGEAVALEPSSTRMARFIVFIGGYDAPPSFYLTDLINDTNPDVGGQAQRIASFYDMLYMPDGRLLTTDSDGVIDLFNGDLTFNRTLDLSAGFVMDWAVNDDLVAIVQRIDAEDDSQVVLTLLSAGKRVILGRIPLVYDDSTQINTVHVAWHPDGALGLKAGSLFRWVDVDAIIDGTIIEIFVPTF